MSEPTAKLPDPTPEEQAQIDADAAYQEAESLEARDRKWERVGSERIAAYADFLDALATLLRPVGGETLPARSIKIDKVARGKMDLALQAIMRDVERLARFTGPRDTHFEAEGEAE